MDKQKEDIITAIISIGCAIALIYGVLSSLTYSADHRHDGCINQYGETAKLTWENHMDVCKVYFINTTSNTVQYLLRPVVEGLEE